MHVSGNEQVIGAFGYCFWSASMPKLNRYRRKGESDPLEQVTNESDRNRIRLTVRAIEGFVMCSVIAKDIVQLLALRFSGRTPALFFRYLRTPSKSIEVLQNLQLQILMETNLASSIDI